MRCAYTRVLVHENWSEDDVQMTHTSFHRAQFGGFPVGVFALWTLDAG